MCMLARDEVAKKFVPCLAASGRRNAIHAIRDKLFWPSSSVREFAVTALIATPH